MRGDNGNDLLFGGSGSNDLYGRSGTDSFMFAVSAFTGIDTVKDFSLSQNDKLDISDLLIGYDPLAEVISDFVQISDNGIDSTLSVDTTGGGDNFI